MRTTFLLAVPCLCFGPVSLIRAERPNVLFIMSDDHAAHAISAYGGLLADTCLEQDPQEMNNLYGESQYAKITQDLKQELERLREQYGDQLADVGDKPW